MQQRDVKGIWIPIEVWTSPDLTSFEKMLLAEIDSFDSGEGCWAGSKYLAKQLSVSPSYINNSIYKLLKDKCLRRIKKGPHKRALRSFFSRHLFTAGGEINSPRVVNSNRGLKKKTSAGRKLPPVDMSFGLECNGHGPLKLSKVVKLFSKFSIKKGYHQQPGGFSKGAQRGGWKRHTLQKWQRDYKWLAQRVDKDKILTTLRWFMDHHNDEFVPVAQSFTTFVKKFDPIDRARKRELKQNSSADNGEPINGARNRMSIDGKEVDLETFQLTDVR